MQYIRNLICISNRYVSSCTCAEPESKLLKEMNTDESEMWNTVQKSAKALLLFSPVCTEYMSIFSTVCVLTTIVTEYWMGCIGVEPTTEATSSSNGVHRLFSRIFARCVTTPVSLQQAAGSICSLCTDDKYKGTSCFHLRNR